jgi:hypothetical protein
MTKDFHGIDLNSLHVEGVKEKMNQPVSDCLSPDVLMSDQPHRKMFDFEKCTVEDLKYVKLEFNHKMLRTALLHGYILFFDAFFDGDTKQEVLHTGPGYPNTHWY